MIKSYFNFSKPEAKGKHYSSILDYDRWY